VATPISTAIPPGRFGRPREFSKEIVCRIVYRHTSIPQEIASWQRELSGTPTPRAGLATVKGAVHKKEPANVSSKLDWFADRVSSKLDCLAEERTGDLDTLWEPGSEACLSCHAEPGWEKRGCNLTFIWGTYVPLWADFNCLYCHPTGASAPGSCIAA
jgi:hypothetical protein